MQNCCSKGHQSCSRQLKFPDDFQRSVLTNNQSEGVCRILHLTNMATEGKASEIAKQNLAVEGIHIDTWVLVTDKLLSFVLDCLGDLIQFAY